MNLYKKSISLEIKADETDERSFTAYASKFGNVDAHGDIVMPGAYSASLASGRKIKLLFNHDPNLPIGKVTEAYEDETGLMIKGFFSDTAKGNEIRQLVLDGAIDSMSVGYRTRDYEYNQLGHRLLKEIDLFEISVVVFPSNDQALITSAKSEDDAELIALLNNRLAILRAE